MARNNADLAHEIEELIKKYNKKPEKKIKKRDIIELFQQCEVIVAAKVDYSDCQIMGEFIENASLKPDVVKDGKRTRLMPVFTTFEQIPVEYMDNFSLIRMSASAAYTYMNDCEELNGLVINPFTEANLELRKKRMTNPNSDATRNFGNTIQPKRSPGRRRAAQRGSGPCPAPVLFYRRYPYRVLVSLFKYSFEKVQAFQPMLQMRQRVLLAGAGKLL